MSVSDPSWYAGERVRVRGFAFEVSVLRLQMQPLTPALSPEYQGEGVGR